MEGNKVVGSIFSVQRPGGRLSNLGSQVSVSRRVPPDTGR